MINSIIAAISVALDSEFGYENHMEEIPQDFKPPGFFIKCINPTTRLFFGKRYFRENLFCIHYFPLGKEGQCRSDRKHKQRECNEVAERMFWCLEYITVEGLAMRGTKMKYEIVEDRDFGLVLHFFLNYDCFVYRVVDSTPMEDVRAVTNVKEGDDVGG